jgi:tRNA pseudouridine55 synthase
MIFYFEKSKKKINYFFILQTKYKFRKFMFDFEAGEVILINKPYEWTSFDVVRKVRNTIKFKKIGHAGTLDPLATGLLILCTGKKTKQINTFQESEKEYTGELVLGATTVSVDLETPIENQVDITHLSNEMILEATKSFVGLVMQSPPLHSAVWIDGKRAYELARKGIEKEIEARQVEIKVFELTEIALPVIKFRIVCSKGTYIRSLVRDFGKKLGVGAYMSALCRTRIGDFTVEKAWKLDDFVQEIQQKVV